MYVPSADYAFVRQCLDHYFTLLSAGLDTTSSELHAELAGEFQLRPILLDPTDLRNLESRLPAPLPSAFRAYLTVGYFRGVEADEFYLPSVRESQPLAGVTPLLLASVLWPCGYLQFGLGPCGDPLCFDLSNTVPGGDYAIVAFNHDLIPPGAWAARSSLEPFAQPVAPSFRALLQRLCSPRNPSSASGSEA